MLNQIKANYRSRFDAALPAGIPHVFFHLIEEQRPLVRVSLTPKDQGPHGLTTDVVVGVSALAAEESLRHADFVQFCNEPDEALWEFLGVADSLRSVWSNHISRGGDCPLGVGLITT